jgi:hypothetical protein
MMAHERLMDGFAVKLIRASLWLLFPAVVTVAIGWWLLVLASSFQVWRESSGAGTSLQVALFFIFPVALVVALRKSSGSMASTLVTFVVGWCAAAAALLFFGA